MNDVANRVDVSRLRSWLFVEGADADAHLRAASSAADVVILELEDFTPPGLRPQARALGARSLPAWREHGRVAAVRINPLESEGHDDLAALMPARPTLVLLPKTEFPQQVVALDRALADHEAALALAPGSTAMVPNVEGAGGLRRVFEICGASPRVVGCLLASEDLAADLGAERGRDGAELAYARARFHVDCVAAGVLSIDCPYTWHDTAGLEAETRVARRLGYRAKSAVHPDHPEVINRVLTPSADAVSRARRRVREFERAREHGQARVEVDGALVELPGYLEARRLLARAAELGVG